MLSKCNITNPFFSLSHFDHYVVKWHLAFYFIYFIIYFFLILFHLVFRISNLWTIFSTLFHVSIWIRHCRSRFVSFFVLSELLTIHIEVEIDPFRYICHFFVCVWVLMWNVKAFQIDKWAVFKVSILNITLKMNWIAVVVRSNFRGSWSVFKRFGSSQKLMQS